MASEVRVSGKEHNWFQQQVVARSHQFFADEPIEHVGTDLGPTPYELLLAALGTCIAITVRMYAKQKEWPLIDVKVKVTHERVHAMDSKECEQESGYVDMIEKRVEFIGELTQEQTVRLIEIAGRCPVHRTLEGSVKIR